MARLSRSSPICHRPLELPLPHSWTLASGDRHGEAWTGSWTEPSVQTVQLAPSLARPSGIRAGSAPGAPGRTSHNPPVVGSSPTRPTAPHLPFTISLGRAVDRQAVRLPIVFRDPALRAKLNAIVHPLVLERIRAAERTAADSGRNDLTVVHDVPLLAATTWVGSQLGLAGLVTVLRRFGSDALSAAARRFNHG
jgi:hypothetical protein